MAGFGARLFLSGQDPTAVRASHDGRTTPGVRRQPEPRQAQRLVGYARLAGGRVWDGLGYDDQNLRVSVFWNRFRDYPTLPTPPVLVDTVGSLYADHMLGKAVTALQDAGGNGKVSEVFRCAAVVITFLQPALASAGAHSKMSHLLLPRLFFG